MPKKEITLREHLARAGSVTSENKAAAARANAASGWAKLSKAERQARAAKAAATRRRNTAKKSNPKRGRK